MANLTTNDLLALGNQWMTARDSLAKRAFDQSLVGQNNVKRFAEAMNLLSDKLVSETGVAHPDMLEALGELFVNASHTLRSRATVVLQGQPANGGLILP